MKDKKIKIRGAKCHNLKNVDLDLPMEKFIVFSGPSGSGKTSLAFQTLASESTRRYLNSFPSSMRFFWDLPQAVEVDSISPVLPVFSLPQENPIVGSRPCVLDVLDLTEKVQKIFFSDGLSGCPEHQIPLVKSTASETLDGEFDDDDILHFFVGVDEYRRIFGDFGFPARSYDQKEVQDFQEEDPFWEVFRLKASQLKKFETKAAELGIENEKFEWLIFGKKSGMEKIFSNKREKICQECDYSIEREVNSYQELSPFNAYGACGECEGHGKSLDYDLEKIIKSPHLSINDGAISILKFARFTHLIPALKKDFKACGLDINIPFEDLPEEKWNILLNGYSEFPGLESLYDYLESKKYKRVIRIFSRKMKSEFTCHKCGGARVSEKAGSIFIGEISFNQYLTLKVSDALKVLESLEEEVSKSIRILQNVRDTLRMAVELNLGGLPLNEKVRNLEPGEYQRLLLVKFLSFKGGGTLTILDEPSTGLDDNEQAILVNKLKDLRDQGNTVVVIEHSDIFKYSADHLVLLGPASGFNGGQVIFEGKPPRKKNSKMDKISEFLDVEFEDSILLKGASIGYLPKRDFEIKCPGINLINSSSDLKINKYLKDILMNQLHFEYEDEKREQVSYEFDHLEFPEFDKILLFDSSIGRVSSRSTFGTYTGFTPELRKHFSNLRVSKMMTLEKGHFSPNSELGRCRSCEGSGLKTVDMHFIEDVKLKCEDCGGFGLLPYVSSISDGHKTFREYSTTPLSEVVKTLPLTAKWKRNYEVAKELNLEYLSLDRKLGSLSGGEKQRLKLMVETTKKIENSLLYFENVSFGLGALEIEKIATYLHKIVGNNNTIILYDQHPAWKVNAHNLLKF